jgi:molybdopterin synthase sulfur carrier subunit
MKITVRVFGDISAIIGRRHEVELTEGATITTIAAKIGQKTGQRQGYLGEFHVGGKDLAILVNGKSIDMMDGTQTKLKDGDEVVVMQPTAGG